jgi:hypothetical protein
MPAPLCRRLPSTIASLLQAKIHPPVEKIRVHDYSCLALV